MTRLLLLHQPHFSTPSLPSSPRSNRASSTVQFQTLYAPHLLQVAKVYASIFGDERGRDVALAGLKAKAKYVRSQKGSRIRLRLTPEIRFIEDESKEHFIGRLLHLMETASEVKNF